jgi:predicted RND superfamily exporter protein
VPALPKSTFRLEAIFRAIIARSWLIIAIYALFLPPAIWFATRVQADNSLERLIVKTDPLYASNQRFEKVFGHGEYAIVFIEADDPFAPEVLRRFDELETALSKVPRVSISSALAIFKRAKGGFSGSPEASDSFRQFATGTDLFRRQGLVGEHLLALPLILNVPTPEERRDTILAIDRVLSPFERDLGPFKSLGKVGQPYVNTYLDEDMRRAWPTFVLFFVFVVVLNLSLYRSVRALIATVLTLGVSTGFTVAFIGVIGGEFTMVSSLVPMTILITCTATLVYLHSRFVEFDTDRAPDEHQAFALANKFLACTASIFATAVGFAALSVSRILPIRELGIWVATGLVLTWVISFTLFPALQKVLRTPTSKDRKGSSHGFEDFAGQLPRWTYRWRWVLVSGSLTLSACGGVALFGLRGVVKPMEMKTNTIDYINHNSELYKNTKRLEREVHGLSMTEIWLHGSPGVVSDTPVLRGLNHLQQTLEGTPDVGAVVGLPNILRTLRYVSGQGDQLPEDAGLDQVAAALEIFAGKEPLLGRFIDRQLGQTHLAVVTSIDGYDGFVQLEKRIREAWAKTVARDPALAQLELEIVGIGPLEAKIAKFLVPTLTESFALTVGIIFFTFLLVFRSGAARLMAMIPSLFAILVMFLVMRITGMALNVGTILIVSTVLGTSENDQIHFFYHFQEARSAGHTTERSLRHTLRIAGRAIFYATLINAGGFLALTFYDLPPIKEFGILSALAFGLSMIADFTALPAALWMVFREKPDALAVNTLPADSPDVAKRASQAVE